MTARVPFAETRAAKQRRARRLQTKHDAWYEVQKCCAATSVWAFVAVTLCLIVKAGVDFVTS